jgi:hypothetical protein
MKAISVALNRQTAPVATFHHHVNAKTKRADLRLNR